MGELSDIVIMASAVVLGSHAIATLGKAYARHKITQEFYPDKSVIERLPRCVYKRVLRPETMKYTLILSIAALASYYVLRNI